MVRFREEAKALQIEVAELKRNRTVIEGVPKREHQAAIDKIASLEERNSQLESKVRQLSQAKPERPQPVAAPDNSRELKELRRRVDTLTDKLSAASETLIRANQKHDEETKRMTAEINRLQCRLRRMNDH